MSKRSEKAKARMERRGEASHARKDPKKKSMDQNITITIDGEINMVLKNLKIRMSEISGSFQRRDKRYRIKVDTN